VRSPWTVRDAPSRCHERRQEPARARALFRHFGHLYPSPNQRRHFIRTGRSLAPFQLWIAHAEAAEELSGLIQAGAIRTALKIMVIELNRIVFPPADFTNQEGPGRLLVQRIVPTTGTGELLIAHCLFSTPSVVVLLHRPLLDAHRYIRLRSHFHPQRAGGHRLESHFVEPVLLHAECVRSLNLFPFRAVLI